MRYSHSRPALTITAPAGGAILTDPARLTNNRPRAVTQFTWPTGAQTTATTMTIRATWSGAISPGVAALLGTSLPAGLPVKVQAFNGSSYVDLAAPSSGTIFQRPPDGKRLFSVVLPGGITATTGLQFVLTNNLAGSPVMTADQLFTIGELWLGEADEIATGAKWSIAYQDSTKNTWSFDQQPWTRKGVAQRVYQFTPAIMKQDAIYGTDSDPTAFDLDALYATLFNGQPVLCVPRYETDSYSARLTNRNTIFGLASQFPGYEHLAGQWFEPQPVKVTESAL